MMKTLKNNRGSTLTAAIIVLLVVLILTGGMYMIATVYYQDSEQNHYYRQAYLFAKSECKVFAQYLSNEGEKSPFFPKKENNSKDTAVTTNITLSKNTESSKNVVKGIKKNTVTYRWYGDHEIKYKVTVNYMGQTSTVTLSCTNTTEDLKKGKWTYLYE